RLRMAPWIGLFATFATALKRFDNGDNIGGDPPIFSVYNPDTIQGFSDATTFVRGTVGIVLDARDSVGRPTPRVIRPVAFDCTGGFGGDHAHSPRFRASLGVPINLWWHTHVLWLYGATEMAWNNGDPPVPFSELPTLGGPDTLRGFRYQDFRDYSSLFFTAE